MKVIVGLGNPGRDYANTRHNVGFMVLSRLAVQVANPSSRHRFRSELTEGMLFSQKLVLVAPQTYMNLSGLAVREVLHWYHLELDDLLIVFDDMDLPYGQLRMRGRGSAGGHNGLQSIFEQLGTTEINRLRIGIGRGRSSSTSHVLSRFNDEEEIELPAILDRATKACTLWIAHGLIAAMNETNRKPEAAETPAREDESGVPA